EEEPVFVLDHESTIVRLRERIAAESAAAIKEYTDALEAIGHRRDETVARADQDLARVLEREWSTLEDTTAQLSRRWREGFEQAYAELGAIQSVAAQGSPSWEHLARDPFSPAVSVPGLVSIGSLRVDLSSLPGGFPDDPRFPVIRPTSFEVPAPLDLRERGSVLLQTGSDSRHAGLAALRAIMLRLLTSLPPAKTRFTILDPVGLGESFAGFMHLADHDPRIVGERIWTESRHIEQRLADLTEHMETVIQKYLRNEFATIQDYNEQAGEIAEPFRFLVIADFPAGFSEAAAKRLASIVAAGPRCGVFTLIAMDTRQRPPAWLPLADIERGSATFVFKGGIPSWREDPFSRWPLTLDGAPSDVVFNRLIHEVGRHAKDSGRVQVPFDTIAPRAGSA
ncbi:MAG TPA: FtsK/SpoIIIE domain-containing protein, partial [Phycisphaerales bacterium]|nr:FtsK/SpoIIIE domain-containing protein [Phycisphaerales bacterium]